MNSNTALVITTISAPNDVLKSFADGCKKHEIGFTIIGDSKSPKHFQLNGCDYYSLEEQRSLPFVFAKLCPERHYARKNIGYLIAIKSGAQVIIESDDDNFPMDNFWNNREPEHDAYLLRRQDWLNVYAYFTNKLIWPRGYPLEFLQKPVPDLSSINLEIAYCPIQQGLADKNPDVDAVFRLTQPLPHYFSENNKIALGHSTWCPYNSQNTTHCKDAFPLLYLPSYCSFRMTDIWRSFVAQRICWENNWHILFEEATVWQDRNQHDLLRDFEDEIPGYLNNAKIATALQSLSLNSGVDNLGNNLVKCYMKLIDMKLVGADEMILLDAWLNDLA